MALPPQVGRDNDGGTDEYEPGDHRWSRGVAYACPDGHAEKSEIQRPQDHQLPASR
jgi:hypothetical protein